jgi:DNA-binding CsgD family transcriptional regulator
MEYKKTEINQDVLKVLPEKEKELIIALEFVDIKPSLTQLATHMNTSVSTVFNVWKSVEKKFDIKMELVPK